MFFGTFSHLAGSVFPGILDRKLKKRGMVYETIEIRPLRAAGGNALGQHGAFCAQAQRRGAVRARHCAAAHCNQPGPCGALPSDFCARQAARAAARSVVLCRNGHRQPASVLLVLFFRHAGGKSERDGGAAVYLSGVYRAAECASVPRNAHAAKASGAGSDVCRLLSGLRARKRQRGVDEGASSGAWLWLFLRALFDFQPLRHRARLRLVDHHVLHLPVLPARQRPACALGSDCAGTVKRCLRSGVRASDGSAHGLSGVYLLYEGA